MSEPEQRCQICGAALIRQHDHACSAGREHQSRIRSDHGEVSNSGSLFQRVIVWFLATTLLAILLGAVGLVLRDRSILVFVVAIPAYLYTLGRAIWRRITRRPMTAGEIAETSLGASLMMVCVSILLPFVVLLLVVITWGRFPF